MLRARSTSWPVAREPRALGLAGELRLRLGLAVEQAADDDQRPCPGANLAVLDAVAATSIFRRLGAPERVRLLVEGESMINDGTALVLYGLAVGVTVGEQQLIEAVAGLVRRGGNVVQMKS